ncbi:MAG: hypothetical protein M1503_10530 [Thaumarchaeota archaeon]|nr:hypothetical protein [Nitrososphaerota archaeon]MCL5318676.1 hypothetical protein [Nitrososphaerota archaeon]
MDNAELDSEITKRLEKIQGFIRLRRINLNEATEILRLEADAEKRAVLGTIPAENRGVREALKRPVVYAVAYRPEFFSSFRERTHDISVMMLSGSETVGEEVLNPQRLRELRDRSDVIFVGSGFVIYKERLRRAQENLKIVLPNRPFPPLEDVPGVCDIVSGSPSPPVDHYLKVKMGVNMEDPDIGTVIVGLTSARS